MLMNVSLPRLLSWFSQKILTVKTRLKAFKELPGLFVKEYFNREHCLVHSATEAR